MSWNKSNQQKKEQLWSFWAVWPQPALKAEKDLLVDLLPHNVCIYRTKESSCPCPLFPLYTRNRSIAFFTGKSYLKCSDSPFIHCSYLLHRVPTEAVWSEALTGKGSVPSGTRPWGQKSASRNVETVVFDEWARYVENAAKTSRSFLSGVLCSRWQGRYQLPLDLVFCEKDWMSLQFSLYDQSIWKREGANTIQSSCWGLWLEN